MGVGAHTDSAASEIAWQVSRYSFAFQIEGGTLIYNARSGVSIELRGRHARHLGNCLCSWPVTITASQLPPETFETLVRGGFLIDTNYSELESIRRCYWDARDGTPLVITVTTTMDCNLGCYYCYEERTTESLQPADVPAIVSFAEGRLKQTNKRTMHIDWYGGEPLLNLEFLETCSAQLQQLCLRHNVRYSASVISNGTCWPPDVESFVTRNRIRQVQISFDGLRANHDRRRRFRKNRDHGESSFDQAIRLVDRLHRIVRVDVRFNIDRENARDLQPFLQLARSRGWFEDPFPAVIQPARLASYSERSSFMRKHELTVEEYDAIRQMARHEVADTTKVEESEAPDGYPYPRSSVCAALAPASAVVGADRKTYRCGLQVGEAERAVGNILVEQNQLLPIIEVAPDREWWDKFDPTTQPNCSRCSFLPICWGGCPKKHLEGDTHAIAEQGLYWRRNLARLVASKNKHALVGDNIIPETLQFRDN